MKCMKCEDVELTENFPYFMASEEDGSRMPFYASICPSCGGCYMSTSQMGLYRKRAYDGIHIYEEKEDE